MTGPATIDIAFESTTCDPLKAALEWAAHGVAVFPVAARGKRPLTPHGFKDATTDPEQIKRWWERWPHANIGVPVPEGCLVIDADRKSGGMESLADLVAAGLAQPSAYFATGGGGAHIWYRLPEGFNHGRLEGVVRDHPGIDVRIGGKHYVVVPPSHHESGGVYWQACPVGTPVELIRPGLLALITRPERQPASKPDLPRPIAAAGGNRPYVEKAIAEDLDELRHTPESGGPRGGRAIATFEIACNVFEFVKAGHVDEAWAREAIWTAARAAGLPDDEIENANRSAWRRVGPRAVPAPSVNGVAPAFTIDPKGAEVAAVTTAAPPVGEPPAGDPADEHRKQLRFAHRLAAREAGKLLHVHGIGWHVWDGTRWAPDDRGAVKRAVMSLLRAEHRNAFGNKELARDVLACQTAAAVDGIMSLAAAIEPFPATVADLDADPWLLNVANGTLDLRTGELRPHDPADRITKVCRAAYDPAAPAPAWSAFLGRVLPDGVREYLRRLVGSALIGRVREHKLPILTGTGRNGKGTFYGALLWSLGDYASAADPELFMARDGAHPTGEMDLRGRRLVVVSESNEGRRLDEAKVKRLCGGDRIKARHMRRDFVEFDPSHQAFYVTNHLPRVRGDDPAIWARLRVIPFDVVIPEDDQDRDLEAKLQAEADAVLAWAVAGLRDYLAGGLNEPAQVSGATGAYHADMDAVARFITERCETTGADCRATTADLHRAWVEWQQQDGCEPLGLQAFGKALDRKNFPVTRSHGQRWRAIRAVCVTHPTDFNVSDQRKQTAGDAGDAVPGSTHRDRALETHAGNASPASPEPVCRSCGKPLEIPESITSGLCLECRLFPPADDEPTP